MTFENAPEVGAVPENVAASAVADGTSPVVAFSWSVNSRLPVPAVLSRSLAVKLVSV